MSTELSCEFTPGCWKNCPRLHAAVVRSLGFSSLGELTYEEAVLLPDSVIEAVNLEFSNFRVVFDPAGAGSKRWSEDPERYEYIMAFRDTCTGPMATSILKPLVAGGGPADSHTAFLEAVCGRQVAKIGYIDNHDRSVHSDEGAEPYWTPTY